MNRFDKIVFFIVRGFFKNAPQPIRFRNILSHLCDKDYQVHVIYLSKYHGQFAEKEKEFPQIVFHEIIYSKISLFIFRHSILNFLAKKIIFPDLFILEVNKLLNKILILISELNPCIIVGSSSPHSIILLMSKIKNHLKGKKLTLIWDIGDPLYKNASFGYFKNKLSYYFENFFISSIDHLVVTNYKTKCHYIDSYKLYSKAVHVIEMGSVKAEFTNKKEITNENHFRMIYAGQFYRKLRNPKTFFQALSIFNASSEKKIIIDLYGNFKNYYKNKFASDFVNFHDSITNEEVMAKYKSADFILFIDNFYGFQLPGKVFELINMQKPVFTVVNNYESISMEYIKDIRNFIISLNNIKQLLNKLYILTDTLHNYNEFPIIDYSWEERARQFDGLINQSF